MTPLHSDERLDAAGMERLLDHVLDGGVHSIFLLGTNGEFQAFDLAEVGQHVRTVRTMLSRRGVRRDLLVGIGAASLREALAKGRTAVKAGADALVACSPYYFIYRTQELKAYFTALADALDRPIILYNSPRYTNNPLTPELVQELACHPNIIGVKDSSGNDELLQEFVSISERTQGFFVTQGAEQRLLAGIRLGAHGITPGLANIVPDLCVSLWHAAHDPDRHDEAVRLQERFRLLTGIHTIQSGIAGTKAALAELGICGPTPVAPFEALDEAGRHEVRRILAAVGVVGASRPLPSRPVREQSGGGELSNDPASLAP